EYQYRSPALQSFPFGNSPDILRTIASKTWDLSNNLSPMVSLPVTTDLRPETVKRLDPMLQTNIISTSDYDRDGPMISEEEYEEMMDKLKAADN
ncbi:Ribosome biogenesis protein Urb2, partial [Operophtera brumata]